MFQSAPLTEARGDTQDAMGRLRFHRFNPLPSPKQGETSSSSRYGSQELSFNPLPSPKQGETQGEPETPGTYGVSIRSPHRSKGRPNSSLISALPIKFQSAPLTEARGDSDLDSIFFGSGCFNPLPSPKQGETYSVERLKILLRSFNPLPSPKQGETTASTGNTIKSSSFNPLPSPKQGETLSRAH